MGGRSIDETGERIESMRTESVLRRVRRGPIWCLLSVCFVLLSFSAHAHKPSDSYLSLQVDGAKITGQWDIALRDLEYAVGLDANEDGEITWGELRGRQQAVVDYAFSHLQLKPD